ncbi:MAG: hypothetical protein AAFP79_10200 [Pseudomonadota bacterium]
MPKEVYIVMMVCAVFFPFALWGMWDSLLRHRQKLAELDLGRGENQNRLENENAELRETVEHMQDRLSVLETIATDPAQRTADEIEALR